MESASIVAKQLSVKHGKQIVLDSLDFTVRPGVLTGLIGPSGAGKTTLLRSIAGLQALSDGMLMVNGVAAGAKSLRGRIGYVTQAQAIYDDLTVEQNLRYFAVLSAVSSVKKRVAEIMEQVELTEHRRQLVATLSGGQKARVSLAIALLGDAKILILDEPTVGLDPILRVKLWRLFRKLADGGRTIIVSSHVMDEAERCDTILLLRDGRLLWSRSRTELLETTATHSVEDAFLKIVEER